MHACLITWLGGARRVVIAGVGSGRGGLHRGRGRPGGGFVNADLRLELWKTPPPVDVLKLLDLSTEQQTVNDKKKNKFFFFLKKPWHTPAAAFNTFNSHLQALFVWQRITQYIPCGRGSG